MRVVVIGASGHFGGRICRRLLGHPGVELIVTSRRLATAEALRDDLLAVSDATNVVAASLDHQSAAFETDLMALAPDVVAHTAGPYQGQSYRVAEACIELACHYIDLADGRDFVCGFEALNERAVASDVLLVSGASTLPGLSTAVIDEFKDRFSRIEAVSSSIAPAHQTPRGIGTVTAVLSYCGRPFEVFIDGEWQTHFGWQDLRVQRYAQLGTRWSGACDVPDLELLPVYVPGLRSARFHAALEAKWEQMALWLMAGVARTGVFRDWQAHAGLFKRISDKLIGFGSDRGGMQMRISGLDRNAKALEIVWDVTAGKNHGPEIPCVPLLILVRKLADGSMTHRGAMPCTGLISLAEFDTEVSDLDIEWQMAEGRA